MRKEGGWQRSHSIGLALSYSRCDFQTNRCKPHPVRGIKQLSEPCFYYLQTIIVSQSRMKNCWRYLNFADFFRTRGGGQHSLVVCCITSFFYRLADFLKLHYRWLQWRWSNYSDATSIGEVPLRVIWKDVWWTPIITVISNIGEDVQYRCFN